MYAWAISCVSQRILWEIVVENGIQLVEKYQQYWVLHLSQLKLIAKFHYRYLLDLVASDFFKNHLSLFASQRHMCWGRCLAGPNFPLIHCIPSSATTQHPTDPFTLPLLIGQEAIHIKSRAINWNWSEIVDCINTKSRFLNRHITRNTCIGYKNFADNKDFKTQFWNSYSAYQPVFCSSKCSYRGHK